MEFPLIGVGCVEGTPRKDEPIVVIPVARLGSTDPTDGAVNALTPCLGETRATGLLSLLEDGEGQGLGHRVQPL